MASRRQLMILGAGLVVWVGGIRLAPQIGARLSGFSFEPHANVPGFRELAARDGSVSSAGGFDVLAGLDRSDPLPPGVMERVSEAPAAALFQERRASAAPAAYFFDYYCPYCRVLSGHLAELAASSDIALTHHHWPVFGAPSVLAARAVLAAPRQGGADALHARLLQTSIRANPAYLEEVSREVGLSWPALERDMEAASVTASLNRARALARLFGFAGTPALVVGRTTVRGEISPGRLRDLARLEREPS